MSRRALSASGSSPFPSDLEEDEEPPLAGLQRANDSEVVTLQQLSGRLRPVPTVRQTDYIAPLLVSSAVSSE